MLGCLAVPGVASEPGATFPQTIHDRLGRTVIIARPPERLVSLAPSNTEILFAIGAGDRIAGVTTYCDHPEAARKLPKIGGFAARTISIEAIVALRPDLVVAGDQDQRAVVEALEHAGLAVISVQPRTFDEVFASAWLFGRLTATEAGAARLVDDMRSRLQAIAERVGQIPADQRVRVYWEVFDQPLLSAGPGSIVGQIIAAAGGVNIFADVTEEYPQVNAEAIVARDPQVILGPASMRLRTLTYEAMAARPGWSRISAIRHRRVVVLPDDPFVRAGPRLVDGVERLAATLYPDFFDKAGSPRTEDGATP